MTPPINIDGTNENYSNVTIDGQDVEQITIDGQDVLSAIPDSALSRFKFEQDVKDSWNDNGGTDNTSADATYVTGQVGDYAKDFRNTNAVVTIPIGGSFLGSSNWSFSMWMNNRSQNSNENVFSYSSRDIGIGYSDINSNGLELQNDNEGTKNTAQFSDSTIGDNTWVMLTVTFDGALTMYADDGSTSTSIDSSTFDPINTNQTYCEIGGNTTRDQYMGVWVDDLRFYTKTLTQAEITNLYNTGSI